MFTIGKFYGTAAVWLWKACVICYQVDRKVRRQNVFVLYVPLLKTRNGKNDTLEIFFCCRRCCIKSI